MCTPHSTAESLVSPAAIVIVETMPGESHARELRKIPYADNTVGRRIQGISEGLCDQ